MLRTYVHVMDTIEHLPERLHDDEQGQDAFEYMLVIGVVMVAVIAAVTLNFTPGTLVTNIVGKITSAINGLF